MKEFSLLLLLILLCVTGFAGAMALVSLLIKKKPLPCWGVPVTFFCFLGALFLEPAYLDATNPNWPVVVLLLYYAGAWCGIETLVVALIAGVRWTLTSTTPG